MHQAEGITNAPKDVLGGWTFQTVIKLSRLCWIILICQLLGGWTFPTVIKTQDHTHLSNCRRMNCSNSYQDSGSYLSISISRRMNFPNSYEDSGSYSSIKLWPFFRDWMCSSSKITKLPNNLSHLRNLELVGNVLFGYSVEWLMVVLKCYWGHLLIFLKSGLLLEFIHVVTVEINFPLSC